MVVNGVDVLGKNVFTFDVFDTCLTRLFFLPDDLLVYLAKITVQHSVTMCSDEDILKLYRLRKKAERVARIKSKSEDITLSDIYLELEALFESVIDLKRMRELEIQLELVSVVKIARIFNEYTKLRDSRKRVYFLSDMYLPGAVIIRMLNSCGYTAGENNVYVSGDIGLLKASGSLYSYFLHDVKAVPSDVIHFGDNYLVDINAAAKQGIAAMHCPDLKQQDDLNSVGFINGVHFKFFSYLMSKSRFFRRVLKDSVSSVSVAERLELSFYEAAKRIIHLNNYDQSIVVRRISVNVAAPLLVSFILWILDRAKKDGVSKLFFVARNGKLLFEMSKVFCAVKYPGIECKYLYGSRLSWHLANFNDIDDVYISKLAELLSRATLGDVFAAVGLSVDEIEVFKLELNLAGILFESIVGEEFLLKMFYMILNNDALRQTFTFSLKARRDNAVAYFEAEGFFDSGTIAVVDVGWELSCHNALNEILSRKRHVAFSGYYFGVRRTRQSVPDSNPFHSFVCEGENRSQDWVFKMGAVMMLEDVFLAAEHGTTIGYCKNEDGKVSPVFDGSTSRNYSPIVKDIQKYILEYSRLMADSLKLFDFEVSEKVSFENFMGFRRFMAFPSKAEAKAFDVLSVNSSSVHSAKTDRLLVKPLSCGELMNIFIRGVFMTRHFHPNWVWLEGSLVISRLPVRLLGRILWYVDNMRLRILSRH